MSSVYFSLSKTGGTGNDSVTVTTRQANNTTSSRSSVITITNGVNTKKCTCIQYGVPAISPMASNPPIVEQTGGTLAFTAVTSYDFCFANIPSWITIHDSQGNTYTEEQKIPANRAVDNTFYFDIAANETGEDRTATDFCMAHYINNILQTVVARISVEQSGEVSYLISAEPTELHFDQTGGTQTFEITCETAWTISSNQYLVQVSPVAGTGNTTVTVTASANTLMDKVISNITASTRDNSVVVKTVQDGMGELCFNIVSGGVITWNSSSNAFSRTIEYRINNGAWTSITSSLGGTRILVNQGDQVRFRGNNTRYATGQYSYCYFGGTASVYLTGYLTSLINPTDYQDMDEITTSYAFYSLFRGYSRLTNAQNLMMPKTSLSDYCCAYMFAECDGLTQVPTLDATVLGYYCYTYMFYGCISLQTAPTLPANTLVDGCYESMFKDCTNLNYIKCLASTISATNCTREWMDNVATTGTFVKYGAMVDNWSRDENGIPSGWTVETSMY